MLRIGPLQIPQKISIFFTAYNGQDMYLHSHINVNMLCDKTAVWPILVIDESTPQ